MLKSIIALLTLLGFFEVIRILFEIPNYFIPSLREILFANYTYHDLLFNHAVVTVREIIGGFSLGVLLACSSAIILSLYRSTRYVMLPIMMLSQSLPSFIIAPLLVLWLGYGVASKIAMTAIMTFFPVVSAAYDGLQQTPLPYIELAHVMNAGRYRKLWFIQIPAALPSLACGLRIAASFAPMAAIIGEWVGASQGLGLLMLNANARLQIDLLFAIFLWIAVLSLLLYHTVDYSMKYVIHWQRQAF